jgi:uncharacterized protein
LDRKGDWLETFSGKLIWPLDPHPNEICIEDIAHALSNICRFNGHTKHHYSVGKHSLNVAIILKAQCTPDIVQLFGLLHDASEAYLCDIPRPLKKYLNGYLEVEKKMQDMIYEKFCGRTPTTEEQEKIHEVDDLVLIAEGQRITNNLSNWAKESTTWIDTMPDLPETIAEGFLIKYESIFKDTFNLKKER